ncbi:hypothetical protein GCM10011415_26980 [Salipiger pallidus]|uniref:Uncharacterized protein n=1 Tax=Salipiger pallidus TaxID=1775170 RepID=A0A8J3EH87_9RHOB|nr:hypothetical protein GCM10011415_26980 [Salipiger pallidus]
MAAAKAAMPTGPKIDTAISGATGTASIKMPTSVQPMGWGPSKSHDVSRVDALEPEVEGGSDWEPDGPPDA